MENLLEQRQKRFRVTGVVLFVSALGLLLCRILARLLPSGMSELGKDAVFSVSIQVVFLLIVPFLIYKFALKKSVRGTLEFSNFRKVDWKIALLCIPLGACVLVITSGVSTAWAIFIKALGYSPSASTATIGPFNPLELLINIALTAVLPAFCEEFTNRGGLLTTMRGSFSSRTTIVLVGVYFGLFHQNITQFLYPMFFGMLMAWLTLRTKSVYPAMIIHFVNNALSVYLDYAQIYPILPFHDFVISMEVLTLNYFPVVVMMYFIVFAVAVALCWLIAKRVRRNSFIIRNSVSIGGITILAVEGEEVDGEEKSLADKKLYKPVLRDWAFYIGALVITFLATIASFVWGVL